MPAPHGVILALDLASATGWCGGAPGVAPEMGTVTLEGSRNGDRGAALDDWLWTMCDLMKPTLIVFEAPLPVHSSIKAGRLALGLAMVVEMVGYRREIPVKECAVTSVRKRIIGSGKADKDAVMAWCRVRGWKPNSLDAADAAALWELACRVRTGKASWE